MKYVFMPLVAIIDIYRNFFYKRNPIALTCMLLFMVVMVLVTAVQLVGDPFFWFGVGIAAYGSFVALPALIYIIDRGYRGGKPRRSTDKLFGPRPR